MYTKASVVNLSWDSTTDTYGYLQKFAFLSRHVPTQAQIQMALDEGIELIPIGDMDAFRVRPEDINALGTFDGVVVVHPAAALQLSQKYLIGVFENANRAPEGEKPQFEAARLYVYDWKRR